MSRVGDVVAGILAAAALAAIAWGLGWLHLGGMAAMDHEPPPAAAAPDDPHAGHAMPVPADDPHADHAVPAPAEAPAMPAGAVMIDAARRQLIGVRTAVAVRERLQRTIRTVGTVTYDERRVAHIHTKVSGWIEKLHVDFTGKLVEEGQPLLEIYSPALVSTQEEYLMALRAQRSLGDSAIPEAVAAGRSLLDATRRRLQLWDITDQQIEELERRQVPQRSLTLYSPLRGFVIDRTAYEGRFVDPGQPLFTIADLSRVWVLADVYESELPFVRVGQPATVRLSYLPHRAFEGRVDYLYPYLEGATRTATVRLVLANPGATLKPEMFANVELAADLGEAIVVPEDAVIDTGERQVVILALEDGHFLPRQVRAGARAGERRQILAGLEEGEVVVSGAAFLIDSESKLRSALRAMPGHQH